MTGRPVGQWRHAAAPRPRHGGYAEPPRSAATGQRSSGYDALAMGRFMLFPADRLPVALRDRAVPLYAVILQDAEAPEMFGERVTWPLDPGDVELLRMVARGEPTRKIAIATGVSMRTVQRQIARLRRRLKVQNGEDLGQYLRDRGLT